MKNPLRTAVDASIYEVKTHAPGPAGHLPLQAEFLRDAPSGDIFGWTRTQRWAGTQVI
jgi:hypothetical protein